MLFYSLLDPRKPRKPLNISMINLKIKVLNSNLSAIRHDSKLQQLLTFWIIWGLSPQSLHDLIKFFFDGNSSSMLNEENFLYIIFNGC